MANKSMSVEPVDNVGLNEAASKKDTSYQCPRCGEHYDKQRGNFPPVVGDLYQYSEYYPICNKCLDQMFRRFMAECGDEPTAIHALCRKLNLYWSERLYNQSLLATGIKSPVFRYIRKLRSGTSKLKTYEDTLVESGTIWNIREIDAPADYPEVDDDEEEEEEPIPIDIINFWGIGLDNGEYRWLEDRYQYYLSRLDTDIIDVGKELLIKQLCNLELDINRSKAEGKSIEKSISALNNILGSLEWKPSQLKDDESYDKNPLGVWIKKFEDERPLPEVDPELEDVDHIIHYVSTFFMGHLAKMIGLKNKYSKMYNDEMKKYTINAPDLEEMDEDDLFEDLFENWAEEE